MLHTIKSWHLWIMQGVMSSEKWTNLRHSETLGHTKKIQKIFIVAKKERSLKLFYVSRTNLGHSIKKNYSHTKSEISICFIFIGSTWATFNVVLQVCETLSWQKLSCCYSSNIPQYWVGWRDLIYFFNVDHFKVSINFSRNWLGLNSLCEIL